MFAEKHYPDIIAPEELDMYLASGWYRMGQTIFTTHFLCFDRTYYSAIWVRLALEGYTFRKSLRKIINKNQRDFRTQIGKAEISPNKERLYQKYKASFKGLLAPSLKDSLLDGEEHNIFNTYEIAVYDSDQLIALSYFDVGISSAASITGIFHPDYDKYSLGFYTMLMEIDFCLQSDLQYFYPGYVVPGYPRFDYKLRIGPVEYYQLSTSQWQDYSEIQEHNIPIISMEQQLVAMQQYLRHHDISCTKFYYPLFESNLFGFWHAPYFDYPVFLLCSPREKTNHFLILVFNPRVNAYQLLHCTLFDDLQFYFNEQYTNSFDAKHNFLKLLVIEDIIITSHSPLTILETLLEQGAIRNWQKGY
jgi:arginyl-tRNA--protein-N-Asp/Glu arginylyltransferase